MYTSFQTSFFPFLSSFPTFFGPSDWLLQNIKHSLMEIDFKLTKALVSFVMYWQHFDTACPQQFSIKGVINFNTS
jgi:hypothetical protein